MKNIRILIASAILMNFIHCKAQTYPLNTRMKDMVLQSQGERNFNFVQLFSHMKIEKIKFIGVNGYNSTNWEGK
ncbi:hypothetical protein [Chryseobacterium mulctrae]|uniref:hypothetical protein n=1 Tax=Chryseobacterium mulctrae TaxID=2576777 RepID=UPI00138FE2B0|nr:hypothetical protein [Chryseobacterium mulctrae]